MEFKELTQEETTVVYGGSEGVENLLYWAGKIAKGFYYFALGSADGGYTYCKCGM